nr:hypothetical protein [Tanacetum cinerariifolium]
KRYVLLNTYHEPIPTFPFVTSSVTATPEHEGGDHTDSLTGLNLQTISAPQRSSVLMMTVVTITTSTANPAVLVKEKIVKPSLFAVDSSSAGGVDPNAGVFRILPEVTFFVTNGSRLDDGRVCREMVDEFASLKFFASIRGMEHDQLFTEFHVRAAHQMYLTAEMSLKAMDKEIENLKAHMVLKEAEVAESIRLCAEASNFVTVEKSLQDEVNAMNECNTILEKERDALDVKVADLEASVVTKKQQLKKFQDSQLKVVNDKFDKLYANFVEMALHLEEKFYPHLLTTISSHRWLLTHGMELAIPKCLNSSEYLSALGAAIGKAIEKGMQGGLSVRITHGIEGRALTDVVSYNPSAEADYISTLQRLQSVNFSLLTELRSNKDASIDIVMNILRLEETLAERLGLTELQSHVDQLMVPIYHSPEKTVVGATSLSFSLDVSNVRVRKIRENITGAGGTSDAVPATNVATMALSITLAYASIVSPIYVDDYVVAGRPSGPSYLGLSFPVSSARLASLSRYTRSTSAVLSVGMSISTGMTTSTPYVNENGVSSLLDFIIVRVPLTTANHHDLRLTALAFFISAGRVPSSRSCQPPLQHTFRSHDWLLNANPYLLGVNSIPSGLVSISLAPEPSVQDDSSVNKIHGLGSSSSVSIRIFGVSSFGRSTMKSANIFPLTDTLGL